MAATSGPEAQQPTGGARHYWRLLRRFAGASAVATISSQLVFLLSYSLSSMPILSTVLGWLAGAVPNFLLNRRTWGSRGRSGLRGELARFLPVSVATVLIAGTAANYAETLALHLFAESAAPRVTLVWGAYLGTYLLMFVVKFFLMDRVVFPSHRRHEPAR
ncbi:MULTISPECIES: GtrA family protein [Actinopolyspora]|uniref:Putative flippase GtrA (Transmembrane translocase of bactoprenol-linked glucose) n=1 Tax=Actinopolyspora saharensis TaxID=995062 RepID=A0A1H1AL66_9ACTN|nr:GtrA family protein [Actinopolyspora saharensis]NHD17041.1 GtrA family protein [Actinopolyspora sp. BKK2]NHE76193.1 GtrA family protein [Actinopolyspora sp. BKK1]SDQ40400.1 Putative flippase GtrA (transmembrane translocase of bactoprenol-linked glucose) [Actinopolyspora saharensis]